MLIDWNRCFPDCEPIGHHLPGAFLKRWVRFHSLPGSKRYPESEDEYAEVLRRHNSILSELTRGESQVVLVTTAYSTSHEASQRDRALMAVDAGARWWRTVLMHELDEEDGKPHYWHLFASIWQWRPGVFDSVVRLVADDNAYNVLLVAADCRWVVHPYDGGMDVLAESSEARDLLRAKYAAWLSALPSGM